MEHDAAIATADYLHTLWLARTEARSTRTKAYTQALAEFRGALNALFRVRLIRTATDADLAVHQAMREARRIVGLRPEYRPSDNREQADYDRAVAEDIARRLGWLDDALQDDGPPTASLSRPT